MESIKFMGANFHGFVNFLQVRGDVISWINDWGRGVERKDNSGKVDFI